MTSVSFINTGSGGGPPSNGELPTTQPVNPGLWINAGKITYWNGTTNQALDATELTEDWSQANW